MYKKTQMYFFDYRFEILGFILTWVLFGGTLIPTTIFNDVLLPVSIIILMGVSIVLVKNKRNIVRFIFIGFAILMLIVSLLSVLTGWHSRLELVYLIVFFVFFAMLSFEVFRQMLQEKTISHSIIIAAFDCY